MEHPEFYWARLRIGRCAYRGSYCIYQQSLQSVRFESAHVTEHTLQDVSPSTSCPNYIDILTHKGQIMALRYYGPSSPRALMPPKAKEQFYQWTLLKSSIALGSCDARRKPHTAALTISPPWGRSPPLPLRPLRASSSGSSGKDQSRWTRIVG